MTLPSVLPQVQGIAFEQWRRILMANPNIAAVTSAYTVKATDRTVLADATAAPFTVSLPPAAQNGGLIVTVKKTDASAGLITVDAYGAETIDGAATHDLAAQYDAVTVQSDGANWYILGTV